MAKSTLSVGVCTHIDVGIPPPRIAFPAAIHHSSASWQFANLLKGATLNRSPFGLDGIPVGDPGFTVSVELSRSLSMLSSKERSRILDVVGQYDAWLDRSVLGNARVVVDLQHRGWWESGAIAQTIATALELEWTVVGLETCRSDLWLIEPFLDHSRDAGDDLVELDAFVRGRNAEPESFSTVILEVEPQSTVASRGKCEVEMLLDDTRYYHSRLSQSAADRPQLIAEFRGDATRSSNYIAKAAHGISNRWSITRIRSVRSDVYLAEVSDGLFAVDSSSAGQARVPEWSYVSNDAGKRMVIVTDLALDLSGWSIESTYEGDVTHSPFVLDSIWMDATGAANLRMVGTPAAVWMASAESGATLSAFLTGAGGRLSVDHWDDMSKWLIDSLFAKPIGLIIDLGPRDYTTDGDDDAVVCAQIQVLDDGVFMLRRSSTVLRRLSLANFSAAGLRLDKWHHDDHFDDCTDGYLFSRDTWLVAHTCAAWFRDNDGFELGSKIGCSYLFPDELPRAGQ